YLTSTPQLKQYRNTPGTANDASGAATTKQTPAPSTLIFAKPSMNPVARKRLKLQQSQSQSQGSKSRSNASTSGMAGEQSSSSIASTPAPPSTTSQWVAVEVPRPLVYHQDLRLTN